MFHLFVDRPILATVLALLILIVGAVALEGLPIAQYPEVAPPTITIQALYPGADAQVVADTVTTPIEQEVNGVERMLFMTSQSTDDGQSLIDVTFETGTDIDRAQVLTQNRVAVALAKLPDEVKRQGVTTKKKSTSILLCVNLLSPDGSRDQLYLSNYAILQVRDALLRIDGVGDVGLLGAREYSMRIWLDPDRLASRGIAAADVVRQLRAQNVPVAAGRLGREPAAPGVELELPVTAGGRLLSAEEFEDVVVKAGPRTGLTDRERFVSGGEVVRLRDVGRAELGARSYDMSSRLDGRETVTLAVFQRPGTNALATAAAVRDEMARLAADFPPGLVHAIHYDTTVFVEESVHEVWKTLFEAVLLVFIVVLLFLQDWRATLVPMIAVPVSLVGTFAVLRLLGFSLNNLSLFGLVLAIGIVVDDAIVVVEAVERLVAAGLPPREAARRALDEVAGPVLAIALVLGAVFVPTAFIGGISGEFYRQFALTIAASTFISAFNSLTLSPALARLLLRGRHGAAGGRAEPLPRAGIALVAGLAAIWLLEDRSVLLLGAGPPPEAWVWGLRLGLLAAGGLAGLALAPLVNLLVAACFRGFNLFFGLTTGAYGTALGAVLRFAIVMAGLYLALMALTYYGFTTVPVGFIPEQDKGYLVVTALLPDGASVQRTEPVVAELERIARETPGVAHVISVAGYSLLANTTLPNAGGMFVLLEPFDVRRVDPTRSSRAVLTTLRRRFAAIREATVVAFAAPPVEGIGNAGGFRLQVRDRTGVGPAALEEAATAVVAAAAAQPGIATAFTGFRSQGPRIRVEVDREKAREQGVEVADVNATLQIFLGGGYVNDFTAFGRNWPVTVQADIPFRMRETDIPRLQVPGATGEMVPLATLVTLRDTTGPPIVTHHNMLPSADVSGSPRPGTSSGDAIAVLEAIAGPGGPAELPPGMDFQWTDLSLQQILAGDTAAYVFLLGTVFVFLVLAGQYESWSLPLAVILIVPMCLLAAIAGVWLAGLDNDIFTQIGLLVLVGLAAKNAILIVEFAKRRQAEGLPAARAVLEAAVERLRPILMTSLAFILGVVPLLLGRGAGSEMRISLGTAVFSGMLGVTVFGIFFTPVFYWLVDRLAPRGKSPRPADTSHLPPP